MNSLAAYFGTPLADLAKLYTGTPLPDLTKLNTGARYDFSGLTTGARLGGQIPRGSVDTGGTVDDAAADDAEPGVPAQE